MVMVPLDFSSVEYSLPMEAINPLNSEPLSSAFNLFSIIPDHIFSLPKDGTKSYNFGLFLAKLTSLFENGTYQNTFFSKVTYTNEELNFVDFCSAKTKEIYYPQDQQTEKVCKKFILLFAGIKWTEFQVKVAKVAESLRTKFQGIEMGKEQIFIELAKASQPSGYEARQKKIKEEAAERAQTQEQTKASDLLPGVKKKECKTAHDRLREEMNSPEGQAGFARLREKMNSPEGQARFAKLREEMNSPEGQAGFARLREKMKKCED